MDTTALLMFLAIGAAAGWLAGILTKGGGFGLVANIVIGVVGSIVGGHLFRAFGISAGGIVGSLVTATVGAIVLLFVVGVIKRHA